VVEVQRGYHNVDVANGGEVSEGSALTRGWVVDAEAFVRSAEQEEAVTGGVQLEATTVVVVVVELNDGPATAADWEDIRSTCIGGAVEGDEGE
jgi:hypothetical protein